jgi:hypothetical protein
MVRRPADLLSEAYRCRKTNLKDDQMEPAPVATSLEITTFALLRD